MGKHNTSAQIKGLRRWTKLAYSCYKRKCRCNDCDLIPDDLIEKCRVKSSVIGLVCKFGIPEEKNIESEDDNVESNSINENSKIS